MNARDLTALQKQYGRMSKEAFCELAKDVLEHPGRHRSDREKLLRHCLVSEAPNLLSQTANPAKHHEALCREYLTLNLCYLKPICSDRDVAVHHRQVLQELKDDDNHAFFLALLKARPDDLCEILKQGGKSQTEVSPRELTPQQKDYIQPILGFADNVENVRRWREKSRSSLIDRLVEQLALKPTPDSSSNSKHVAVLGPSDAVVPASRQSRWRGYQEVWAKLDNLIQGADNHWLEEEARRVRLELEHRKHLVSWLVKMAKWTLIIFFALLIIRLDFATNPNLARAAAILWEWTAVFLLIVAILLMVQFVSMVNWGLMKVEQLRVDHDLEIAE
ncbi:MAG: hypothetical protein IPK19_25990 [Chloroflexi bacterium]|nr:hypothetical protein [Chloroflexota bacterium]